MHMLRIGVDVRDPQDAHLSQDAGDPQDGHDAQDARDPEDSVDARDLAQGTNLLGAVSLAVTDRVRAAAERGAAQGGSAPAALVSLAGFFPGAPVRRGRGPPGAP